MARKEELESISALHEGQSIWKTLKEASSSVVAKTTKGSDEIGSHENHS